MRISMFLLKIYRHLLRCYTKTIHPCIVLATSFGFTETSRLIEPAASVPLLKILTISFPPGWRWLQACLRVFFSCALNLLRLFLKRLIQKLP
ncbi:hypothetical protein C5N99_09520 [Treponema medium]|uniref:Uncharacterized protein n=1 Tax=Treponema medium TaxID=58231 RepID=A0ABX7LXY8_TREMD|nr:hypothetical protein C5N99_09520 [Treponema medium]QSH97833.1 hypothetical protein DWB79_08755 [Treponema medium]